MRARERGQKEREREGRESDDRERENRKAREFCPVGLYHYYPSH